MADTRSHYDTRTIPVPPPPGPPRGAAGGGRGSGASIRSPLGTLRVADLRHPTEPSRFALALTAVAFPVAVALFVLTSLGQVTVIVAVMLGIALVFLIAWVTLQIWRVRLLGDALLVSSQTLPELQEVVDLVRARLNYTRRVDLFVVEKISRVLSGDPAPITLTSFFGVHVLVAEGDALGDLAKEGDRQKLLFTLATYVGALKARYTQWWHPLFAAFEMTGLAWMVWPFVFPYRRATVYSGDRIAYACCGDLDISLQSVYRFLVGKDVAERIRAEGLTGQALVVRRRPLLRFAQLLRSTPHATNRYLHLLAYIRQQRAQEFFDHRPPLAGPEAEPVLHSIGAKRAHPVVVPVGVCLALALVGGGVALGLEARNSPIAQGIAAMFQAEGGTTPTPTPTPIPTPGPPPLTADEQYLLSLVPASLQNGCAAGGDDAGTGAVAALSCALPAGQPEELLLLGYGSTDAMHAAFGQLTAGVPDGDCATGNGRSTWNYGQVPQGPLACYSSTSGSAAVLWGSDAKGVLVQAQDALMSAGDLFEWWKSDAPHLQ